MFRSLIAALYLIMIPGPAAWAQAARAVQAPTPLSPSMAVLPVLNAPLGGTLSPISASLGAALPIGAPALSAPAPAPASAAVSIAVPAAAAQAAPAAAAAAAPSAGPAQAALEVAAPAPSDSGPTALSSIRSAASEASGALARPSGAESAAAGADFADGLRRRADGALSVLAGGPRRWISALSPARRPEAARPSPSAVHGYPGRLIVSDGLDGSGKSTQMEMLKKVLESQGVDVVVTSWNSSESVGPVIKRAKKDRTLTPEKFSELEKRDFDDRIRNVVIPALRRGAVVLADRWFFTALARDSVRGLDPAKLRETYASALRPDLTLYFKAPVKTATERVLARTEGRLGLSENFEENKKSRVLGMNYYAAWADVKFSDDPRRNYEIAQERVAESYDAQAEEFGFRVVDSARSREEIHADVMAAVGGALGPLEAFRRRDAASRQVPAPAAADKTRRPFYWGVFAAQLGNFGIQGILAAVILSVPGGSVWWLFFTVGATAMADSVGSFVAGWLAEKNPMKAVRLLTGARAAVLLSIPLLSFAGVLSLPLAVGAFMLDALMRGVIDAASFSYLATAGGSSKAEQKAVNSEYSSKFELGAIAGPAAVAAILAAAHGLALPAAGLIAAAAFIPASFLAAAFLFARAPEQARAVPAAPSSPGEAARTVFSNPMLRAGFLALLALTLYPLRNALPQMYATMLFHNPLSAGWLVAVFGLGGVAGSWLFQRPMFKNVSLRTWGLLGAAGTVALAAGWIFPTYAWAVPALLLFSVTNMTARIAVQSEFMSRLPADKAGSLSAFSRAGVKFMAMAVKYLPSLSTMLVAASSRSSFLILGAVLVAFALAQLFATKSLSGLAMAGALVPALGVQAVAPADAVAPAAAAAHPFYRNPEADRAKYSPAFMEEMLDAKKGRRFFYRVSRLAMKDRFDQFAFSRGMPQAVLHGNPIMENVKRTPQATWVEDFDNSGVRGKYGFDIVRHLVSLSYYRKASAGGDFLGAETVESFKKGYLSGLRNPEAGFPGMDVLEKEGPAEEQTMNEYFAADRKKIRELRENPLAVDDRGMLRLLKRYLKSVKSERLLKGYAVELAGKTRGTTERWDVTLILLKPKDAEKDRVLLAIKTPFLPETLKAGDFGRRVVESARRFAPGTLRRSGYFVSEGKGYYGYQVSTSGGKIKKKQSDEELAAIAYSVGAELGRGARLSLKADEARVLIDHAEAHFAEIVAAGATMKGELDAAYSAYAAYAAETSRQDSARKAAAAGEGDDDEE